MGQNDLPRDFPTVIQRLTLTLPVPPSLNHMYVNAGRKKTLTKDAREMVKTIQYLTSRAIKEQKWKRETKEDVWYIMELKFFFKDLRKTDTHNRLKLLLDSTEGVLYPDDYYVLPRIMYAGLDRDNPRVEIEFYAMTEEEYKTYAAN